MVRTMYRGICTRCGGTGYLHEDEVDGVYYEGVCPKCDGSGKTVSEQMRQIYYDYNERPSKGYEWG